MSIQLETIYGSPIIAQKDTSYQQCRFVGVFNDAIFQRVRFAYCDFSQANIDGATFIDCAFIGCDLTSTCLAPDAPLPHFTPYGFDRADDSHIFAYLTTPSPHWTLQPNQPAVASVFSVSQSGKIHPGLYVTARKELPPHQPIIPVVVKVSECVRLPNDLIRVKRVRINR